MRDFERESILATRISWPWDAVVCVYVYVCVCVCVYMRVYVCTCGLSLTVILRGGLTGVARSLRAT